MEPKASLPYSLEPDQYQITGKLSHMQMSPIKYHKQMCKFTDLNL